MTAFFGGYSSSFEFEILQQNNTTLRLQCTPKPNGTAPQAIKGWRRLTTEQHSIELYGIIPSTYELLISTRQLTEQQINDIAIRLAKRETVLIRPIFNFYHNPFGGIFLQWTPNFPLPNPIEPFNLTPQGTNTSVHFTVTFEITLANTLTSVPTALPLPKRQPRKFGRSARPAWLKFHSEWKTGRKFTRQTAKLTATPNDKGFGNDGTSDWKENIRDAAKRVAVDAAKAAVSSAAKGLSDAAAKKAGATIKKRAANALKEIIRKR